MNDSKNMPKRTTGDGYLDELLGGGLPEGRVTLLCGGPGTGKTLLGIQVLVSAAERGAHVLHVSFEDRWQDILQDTSALEFDLQGLRNDGCLRFEYLDADDPLPDGAAPSGALEVLVARLATLIQDVDPDVVLVDGLEPQLQATCGPVSSARESHRVMRTLRDCGATAILVADAWVGMEGGSRLEAQLANCVIHMEMRQDEDTVARRLCIRKYPGMRHPLDPFTCVIGRRGVTLPSYGIQEITAPPSGKTTSCGIPRLDQMLGGGVREGVVVYVGGASGTGKTSLVATAAEAACRRGEQVLFLSFEESTPLLQENMRSIGIDLGAWVEEGLLNLRAIRPFMAGLEQYLLNLAEYLDRSEVKVAVLDPVTAFQSLGDGRATAVMAKAIDMMKSRGITVWCTGAMQRSASGDLQHVAISALVDILVRLGHVELPESTERAMHIVKARGQKNSSAVRRFRIGSNGIQLQDAHDAAEQQGSVQTGQGDLETRFG